MRNRIFAKIVNLTIHITPDALKLIKELRQIILENPNDNWWKVDITSYSPTIYTPIVAWLLANGIAAKVFHPWENYDYLRIQKPFSAKMTDLYDPAIIKLLEIINIKSLRESLTSKQTSHIPVEKKSTVEIPDDFLCVITQEIMIEPVVCTLDGITYEASAIREWLNENRKSPCTRKPMSSLQTTDEVLIKNRNLENLIKIFRQDNPQLFNQQMNAININKNAGI